MTHAAHALGSEARPESGVSDLLWPAAISLVVLLGIVSGGSSQADSIAFTLFKLLSALLFAAALIRLLNTRLATAECMGITLAVLTFVLVGLHLVPLPYELFAALPGRSYVATAFSVAGIPAQWMPLTLSRDATWACLLALMPPLAIFLAALTTNPGGRWLIMAALLLGVIGNVMLGLAQRFEGPDSSLYLYEISNFGSATGFFSNRNNFAILLCVAVPVTWAVSHRLAHRHDHGRLLAIAGGAVMIAIIFVGLAVSGSRSGIVLGMLSLALSTAMIWSPSASRRSSRGRRSLLATLGAALIIGQFGMIGILRIAETNPLTDYRAQISRVTLGAASDYLPIGSGFGTFQSIYAMHETPATMLSEYVNHAHNDWLELWLEGGFPAAILMAAFVVLFLWQAARVWNPRGPYAPHVLPRAASIGVLVLLLHSVVEYPLRMPSLADIFALLMAIMLSSARLELTTRRRRHRREEYSPEPHVPVAASKPPVFSMRVEDEPDRKPLRS
jgi:O-antigen ligase